MTQPGVTKAAPVMTVAHDSHCRTLVMYRSEWHVLLHNAVRNVNIMACDGALGPQFVQTRLWLFTNMATLTGDCYAIHFP